MSEIRVLFVTIPSAQADAYVQALCRERVVACGNILPGVRSHYWWQGALCQDEEAVVLMETALDRVDQAMERAVALHPYECPKVIALAPSGVHAAYAAWAVEQTRPPS
jgi:periplasmic divalent cation tolerance protein